MRDFYYVITIATMLMSLNLNAKECAQGNEEGTCSYYPLTFQLGSCHTFPHCCVDMKPVYYACKIDGATGDLKKYPHPVEIKMTYDMTEQECKKEKGEVLKAPPYIRCMYVNPLGEVHDLETTFAGCATYCGQDYSLPILIQPRPEVHVPAQEK